MEKKTTCTLTKSEHYQWLLINGYCHSCLRSFSLPNEDTKVFERLENIKKASV